MSTFSLGTKTISFLGICQKNMMNKVVLSLEPLVLNHRMCVSWILKYVAFNMVPTQFEIVTLSIHYKVCTGFAFCYILLWLDCCQFYPYPPRYYTVIILHDSSAYQGNSHNEHDDVIKWKHFPRNWPFVRGIHRSRWIPHTKASDAELWCLLWSASE